jgi:hypothetical protein
MTVNEIIKTIDTTDARFASVVDDAQRRMLKDVIALTKDLEVRNGNIVSSAENLKIINQIKAKLNKSVLNKDYQNGVKELLKSFDDIQTKQVGYFSSVAKDFKPTEKYKLLKNLAIENTATQLTESGIDANVTDKIKSVLINSITSGQSYSDMVGSMTELLTDTEKSAGALSKYAKTYTSTALNQFAGQTNKLMTEDSGFEWFRYVGSNSETTREWCELMTEKDYVHISELPEVVKGHIDGKKCEIYEKTGLPKGMIDGTNANNLQINCGGWGCRHQLMPVLTSSVPKALRMKFVK